MSDQGILQKVEEFLMDDDKIGEDFEKFATDNCDIFEDTEENKLEYMDIYKKFTDLFNERIEAFITKNNSTLEEFVAACENASNEEGDENFAVQLILSITSFEAFKEMMVHQKKVKSA